MKCHSSCCYAKFYYTFFICVLLIDVLCYYKCYYIFQELEQIDKTTNQSLSSLMIRKILEQPSWVIFFYPQNRMEMISRRNNVSA